MFNRPIKIADIELSSRINPIEGLNGYQRLQALVRLHGVPMGYVKVPVTHGRCSAAELRRAAIEKHGSTILHHLLYDRLKNLRSGDSDRGERCLESLSLLHYPALDLVVVDNAPSDDATEHLVRKNYPQFQYLREDRPGLNWARNRAILEAKGEIIAFTDDDAVVDPGWVRAIANVFKEDPEVMAVTGLVVPYELETEAQVLFERYSGFGRGFERKWCRMDGRTKKRTASIYGSPGKLGTGANMAFRRSLFDQIGFFDPAMDMGTPTIGGGDIEMFFRVLKEGYTLVYEPAALVRHCHRSQYDELLFQIKGWGTGFCAHVIRSALAYPEERFALIRFGLKWLWWLQRRLLISFLHPSVFMRDLALAQLRGALIGTSRYLESRRHTAQISRVSGSPSPAAGNGRKKSATAASPRREGMAVRTVDLSLPLQPLVDVKDYAHTRIVVTRNSSPLGHVDVENGHRVLSVPYLKDVIVRNLSLRLVEENSIHTSTLNEAETAHILIRDELPEDEELETDREFRLPADVSVSVVVATLNRPDDLRQCLRNLRSQKSPRPVEIIVVDNDPGSDMTPPVVAEFPRVRLVREPRRGISYARNAGIAASTGEIIVTTDDDVTTPPDWLEKLIAPFVRDDVMVVTGNVLPKELEAPEQRLFEAYGGLGRGFNMLEADGDWFASFKRQAVPAWRLGSTANAAFRAAIFAQPEIGLFSEALGVGSPAGCDEGTYLFYKVVQAGYTLIYKPAAYAWHKHPHGKRVFWKQIYNYSKGHVAYQVMTLVRERDLRAVIYLFFGLPKSHLWRLKEQLRGRSIYPSHLMILEVIGNLIGPFALWRSSRRVKREGRSEPYVPTSERITSHESPR